MIHARETHTLTADIAARLRHTLPPRGWPLRRRLSIAVAAVVIADGMPQYYDSAITPSLLPYAAITSLRHTIRCHLRWPFTDVVNSTPPLR